MSRLKIGFDMDGILVDLTPHWLKCIAEDHGIHVNISEIDQWSLHKCGDLVKLGAEKVYAYMKKPGFFRHAPPIPAAVAVLKRLAKDHDIFIVSSPSSPISASEKIEWLAEHLPDIKISNICLFPTKTMVKVDVLVDDHPETVLKYREAWPDALVLGVQYEYNKNVPCDDMLQIYEGYKTPEDAWAFIEDRINLQSMRLGPLLTVVQP